MTHIWRSNYLKKKKGVNIRRMAKKYVRTILVARWEMFILTGGISVKAFKVGSRIGGLWGRVPYNGHTKLKRLP